MPENKDIQSLRREYRLRSLLEKDVDSNPMLQFEKWWDEAIKNNIVEPNAMTLATCNSSGKPSARIVLLKGLHEDGFLFFTNYDSRKGKEIEINPFVSLVFLWKEIERQVRIEGSVEKISEAESDAYFSKRPRESRIGAWSSHQSTPIERREVLEKNYEQYDKKFTTDDVPRPKNWGGYIVHPNLIEFWQGRQGRLHDRLQYNLSANKTWKIERLAP